MVSFQWIMAVLAFLFGLWILVISKSGIYETEAFVLWLISAVFISGAGTISALDYLQTDVKRLLKQMEPKEEVPSSSEKN